MRKKEIRLVKKILQIFEREKDIKTFPGRGSFFLVFGAWLALAVFPKPIVLASVTIMAIGDSLATIIGKYIGRIPLPFNKEKSLEGSMIAFLGSVLAASYFVPFPQAMIGGAAAMFIEALPLKIDDNAIIPLIAGWTMMLI